ncbi:TauD/TfdA family dioxygenase [Nocardia sp. NPDC055053]
MTYSTDARTYTTEQPSTEDEQVPPVCTLRPLSALEQGELAALGGRIDPDAPLKPSEFARHAHLLSRRLPTNLADAAYEFDIAGGGLLLVSGAVVGSLPNTPSDPLTTATQATLMARQSAILAAGFGHLVGYRCESAGLLCQTIVPVRAHSHQQMSTGAVDLESHTEQCFNLVSRPDFVVLACLRGDPGAATYALSARTIARELPADTVAALREEQFFTRIDASFVAGGVQNRVRGPLAVLAGPAEDPIVRYDEDLMFGHTRRHTEALAAVRALWYRARTSVVLRPGDILVLDNSRVVHGRSRFHPQYDGGDRWLARWQVAKSLAHTRFARRGRSPVIEPHGC